MKVWSIYNNLNHQKTELYAQGFGGNQNKTTLTHPIRTSRKPAKDKKRSKTEASNCLTDFIILSQTCVYSGLKGKTFTTKRTINNANQNNIFGLVYIISLLIIFLWRKGRRFELVCGGHKVCMTALGMWQESEFVRGPRII